MFETENAASIPRISDCDGEIEQMMLDLRALLTKRSQEGGPQTLRSIIRCLIAMDAGEHEALISLYSRGQEVLAMNSMSIINDCQTYECCIHQLYPVFPHIASYLTLFEIGVASMTCERMTEHFVGTFRSLRLGGSKKKHVMPVLRRIVGPYLKEVVVCGSYVEDEWIHAVVQNCRNLHVISFGGPKSISDLGLTFVAQNCPLLTHLSILECEGVTDEGFVSLVEHCDCLASLSILGCNLSALVEVVVEHNPQISFDYTVDEC